MEVNKIAKKVIRANCARILQKKIKFCEPGRKWRRTALCATVLSHFIKVFILEQMTAGNLDVLGRYPTEIV